MISERLTSRCFVISIPHSWNREAATCEKSKWDRETGQCVSTKNTAAGPRGIGLRVPLGIRASEFPWAAIGVRGMQCIQVIDLFARFRHFHWRNYLQTATPGLGKNVFYWKKNIKRFKRSNTYFFKNLFVQRTTTKIQFYHFFSPESIP